MADDANLAVEANRLYWESDLPVAGIAERLDLSRRALYDAVQPAPAGILCPHCGTELEYGNRTARAAREATCPECGAEEYIGADEDAGTQIDAASVPEGRGAPASPLLTLGSVAIAGAALGAAAVLLLSRRR